MRQTWEPQLFIMFILIFLLFDFFAEDKVLYCHYRVGHERQKRNEHSADIHSSAAVKAERQYKRCRIKYQYKNPSSQAYAHVFSANFHQAFIKHIYSIP